MGKGTILAALAFCLAWRSAFGQPVPSADRPAVFDSNFIVQTAPAHDRVRPGES